MEVVPPILPRTIFLNLTDSCNLNCPWCGVRKGNNFLPLKTAQIALTWAKRLGAKYAVLVGGEPTLHPHFFTLVLFSIKIGLHPLVVTNGVICKQVDFCEKMRAAGLTSSDVALSFHAITGTNSAHKAYLHPGLKKVFERAVRGLKSVGIEPSVNVVLTRHVLKFKGLVPYLASLGISNLQLLTLRTGDGIDKDPHLFPRDLHEVADYIWYTYQAVTRYQMRMSVGQPPPLCFFSPEAAETLSREWILQTPCGVRDKSQIVITAQGEVTVCNFVQNLSRLPLTSVLGITSFKEVVDTVLCSSTELRSIFQLPLRPCLSCKIKHFCLQSCPLLWRDYPLASTVVPVEYYVSDLPPWVGENTSAPNQEGEEDTYDRP